MNTVESEIDIHGQGPDSRRNIRLNGKPWNKPSDPNPTFNWYIGFGQGAHVAVRPEMFYRD